MCVTTSNYGSHPGFDPWRQIHTWFYQGETLPLKCQLVNNLDIVGQISSLLTSILDWVLFVGLALGATLICPHCFLLALYSEDRMGARDPAWVGCTGGKTRTLAIVLLLQTLFQLLSVFVECILCVSLAGAHLPIGCWKLLIYIVPFFLW